MSAPLRRRRLALGAGAALVALAGCAGGDGGSASTTDEAAPTTTTVPVLGALTGLPTPNAARPTLVVKVDNAPAARPQSGLEKADLVFEEVVEGGETRFLAVFQSQDSELVGPVRSVRPVDPDIVTPLRGLFAYSGGAPQFTALIKEAPVTLVGVDELRTAYSNRRDRKVPSNLYTSTKALYEGAKADDKPPRPFFRFLPAGQAFAPAGAVDGTHLTVKVTSRVRADWDFDAASELWRRATNGTPHRVEGGGQLGFTNVMVQFVAYRDSGSFDSARNPVPTADVVGQGPAIVLSGGKIARATWSKASAAAATTYNDSAGAPLALSPGTTWVTLAPTGATTATQ